MDTQFINSSNDATNKLDANNNNILEASSSCLILPEEVVVSGEKRKSKQQKSSSIESRCLYQSYFYSNQNTVLNCFVMGYEEQLHKAIAKGNFELCKELVELDCDLNKQVISKLALGVACEYNYYEIVELLLRNGAEINKVDFFDQTALFYAVNSADLDVIKLLVHHGARINVNDSNGTYPLHLAICRKNDEICDYLINHGAIIDALDRQDATPLSLAISNEYIYMINQLLDRGADPNLADKNGDTPLIKAIWSTMTEAVGNDEVLNIIKKLISLGADIDAKNDSGRTALYTAVYQNNTDIALYLINEGAKCEIEDCIMGNFTLLHYACFQGNLTLAKALIGRNCNVNATASNNETPVYIASTKGYLDIIDVLIENHANVNVFAGDETDNKCTPIQAAIYYITEYDLFKSVVSKLIMGNADISIDTPGPLLVLCLQYNKYNFAKFLVSIGANVEQRTIFNQSCFYKAFLSKNLEFMEMAILAGFNLHTEEWVSDYLINPDFIENSDYYINNPETAVAARTEEEIAAFLDEEEYFNRRFRTRNQQGHSLLINHEIRKKVYNTVKHYYSNPLSLQELSRIAIRKHLLKIDYKIHSKISSLFYPNRLKDYLLFKEFDI